MQFKWDDTFATGHAEVDEQHQKIFAYLGELDQHLQGSVSAEWLKPFFTTLEHYIRNHFYFEEMSMRKAECPTAQKNKAQHKKLLAALNKAYTGFEADGYKAESVERLQIFLGNWFTQHILKVDIKLRDCI